ncbi:MAG: hypothetical protein WAM59_02855, partial [Candidatus Acidiferrales bacterium]
RFPYARQTMLAPALMLVAATGCNSSSPTNKTANQNAAQAPAAVAQNAHGPGINLNCIVERLQNPPEAFHYSFKNNGQPHFVDDEADVTPQTIDGTFESNASDVTKPPMTSKVHAVRSDNSGWQMAVGSLNGVMGMDGLGGLVEQNAVREGTEKVNGYDTIKYSVDTARGNPAGVAIMLGQGGFMKGTVWVTSDGCPVKMSLDEEAHEGGSVEKDHFEEAIIKK